MKTVVWIVILFAAAVGLALASGIYTGDVFIVLGQTMLRINLHAFVLGSLIAVVVWYFLFKFIIGVFNIPEKMQRFSLARKGRKAALYLNKAGLAYFEGRFEKAELEAWLRQNPIKTTAQINQEAQRYIMGNKPLMQK